MRMAPPTRTSRSHTGFVNPFGPHHCATCLVSVHALNTSSRGASNTRVITRSHSEDSVLALLFVSPIFAWLVFASLVFASLVSASLVFESPILAALLLTLRADMLALLRFHFQIFVFRVFSLQFLQIISQPVKALFPESPVVFHPSCNVLQRPSLQPAGPPLRLAPP